MSNERSSVIYGVYDNRNASFMTKLNDFFIDRSKVSLKEKAYFYELLSLMMEAGIPLLQGLHILEEKTVSKRFSRVIATLAYFIERGDTFAISITKFPMVFNQKEIGVIQSGEMTGTLSSILGKLAKDTSMSLELHLKIRQALAYPLTILLTLVIALFVILGVVLPPLINLFTAVSSTVPASLAFLIGISTLWTNYWFLILIVLVLIFLSLRNFFKSEKGQNLWHTWSLSIPVFGHFLQKLILVRFSRNLGILLESGIPVITALKTSSLTVANGIYKKAIDQAILEIQQGKTISQALSNFPDLFPGDLIALLHIGEKTASIPLVTEKISYQYEREVDYALKNLTNILEPIAIIVVGIVVGWFAFVILGSIFSLSEYVG